MILRKTSNWNFQAFVEDMSRQMGLDSNAVKMYAIKEIFDAFLDKSGLAKLGVDPKQVIACSIPKNTTVIVSYDSKIFEVDLNMDFKRPDYDFILVNQDDERWLFYKEQVDIGLKNARERIDPPKAKPEIMN